MEVSFHPMVLRPISRLTVRPTLRAGVCRSDGMAEASVGAGGGEWAAAGAEGSAVVEGAGGEADTHPGEGFGSR